MAKYKDTIITNQGSTMADKALHGTASYDIFKATGSATDLSKLSDDEVQNLTKIQDDTKVGYINDSSDDNDNSHTTTLILFNNKDVNQGYYLNTIALWGKDKKTNEVFLYSVTRADQAEYIPAYQDKVLMEFKIRIQIKIGNKANVTIVLNSDVGATINYVDKKTSEITSKLADYLTKNDFNNEKKTINNSLDNKVNNSDFNNFKTDNNKNLSNKADKSDLNTISDNVAKDINPKIDSLQKNKADNSYVDSVKEFTKYPQQILKSGDVITDLSDGFYTSWGIKNLDLPNLSDTSFWGTVFKTTHYIKAIRNDGNIYIKNHYANKWSSWQRVLNEGDSNSLINQINSVKEIAKYPVTRQLTKDDDLFNFKEKGHFTITTSSVPKNAPYSSMYGDVYADTWNIVVKRSYADYYVLSLAGDSDMKWHKLADTNYVDNKDNAIKSALQTNIDKKAEKSYVDTNLATKATIATDESISGSKNFTNGLKISDKNLYVKEDKLYYEDKPVLVANAPNAPKLELTIDKNNNYIQYQVIPPSVTGGAEITGYIIYWKKQSESNWQSKELDKDDLIGELKAEKSSYYDVKVIAKNYAGNSAESEIYNILSAGVPKITSLNITPEYPTKMNINIDCDNGGANAKFVLYYKSNTEEDWKTYYPDSPSFSLDMENDNTEYDFKVKAFNVVGDSEESNIINKTTVRGRFLFGDIGTTFVGTEWTVSSNGQKINKNPPNFETDFDLTKVNGIAIRVWPDYWGMQGNTHYNDGDSPKNLEPIIPSSVISVGARISSRPYFAFSSNFVKDTFGIYIESENMLKITTSKFEEGSAWGWIEGYTPLILAIYQIQIV